MNLPANIAARAAGIRDRLAAELNLTPAQAAGIVGNLQGELGQGIRAIQEGAPIRGRGGFGWAQWTGPRRVAFEAYAKQHGLDIRSDEANFGFLKKELSSPEYAKMMEQIRQQQGSNAAAASANIVLRQFERPKDPDATQRARQQNAIRVAAAASPTAVAAAPPALPQPSPAAKAMVAPAPTQAKAEPSFGGDAWAGTQTLTPVGASTAAQASMTGGTSSVDRSQSSQTHIGNLHVHTAATDASGIAKSIKGELQKYDYVAQADTGLV